MFVIFNPCNTSGREEAVWHDYLKKFFIRKGRAIGERDDLQKDT